MPSKPRVESYSGSPNDTVIHIDAAVPGADFTVELSALVPGGGENVGVLTVKYTQVGGPVQSWKGHRDPMSVAPTRRRRED